MQDIINTKKQKLDLEVRAPSIQEKNRLVNAFAWLIQEDKKQNPDLYQIKKHKHD